MFLTKKSILKIVIMAVCYFLIGSLSIATWFVFVGMGIYENFLLILGIITYLLGALMILLGRFAEGKGKLINLGTKLVRNELKPAEFIKHYESVKNSGDLVLNKPSIEVLQLVIAAYDSLNDKENALATADEMINAAKDKKKNYAKLIKTSLLFDYGTIQEAEALFNSIKSEKLDIMSAGLADAILKSDRAKAMEDYKTVEAYNLMLLERSFPKLDNLGKLVVHYQLGEVYAKLQENENAVTHYQYCVNFGGETEIKKSASEKLENLK